MEDQRTSLNSFKPSKIHIIGSVGSGKSTLARNEIIASSCWIIEGVHFKPWVMKGFEQADLIIYLDTPIWKRNYRIAKRYVLELLGLQKGNY